MSFFLLCDAQSLQGAGPILRIGIRNLEEDRAYEATKVLAVWQARDSAAIYRIKAGRSFMEYQPGKLAEWRKTLSTDPEEG